MKNTLIKSLTLIMILGMAAVSGQAFGQTTGIVTGVIQDSLIAQPIPMATVNIEGTSIGAVATVDGVYQITLKPGTYQLAYSSTGFTKKIVEVTVKAGQTITQDVMLAEPMTAGVVIEVERIEQTEAAATEAQKEAEVVAEVISQESISKTEASNAGAVVSRIPGITLIDGKFVIVRGLSQRYNNVKLNGLSIPSTDPTTRAFSFDIIPSSVIGTATTYKSFGADMGAEVAGAAVNITTLTNFDEPFNEISVKMGYRFGTTLQDGFSDSHYSTADIATFGKGDREWPAQTASIANSSDPANAAQATSFDNTDFFGQAFTVAPDFGISAKTGKIIDVAGSDLLFTGYASLSNSTKIYTSEQARYSIFDSEFTPQEFTRSSSDTRIQRSAKLALMGNLLYDLPGVKLTFQNLYNRIGSSEVINRDIISFGTSQEIRVENVDYLDEVLLASQLGADFEVGQRGKLKAVIGYAKTDFDQPNRRATYRQRSIGSTDPYEFILPEGGAALVGTTRFSSVMDESSISGAIDLSRQFGQENAKGEYPLKLKMGGYVENRVRTFTSRNLAYGQSSFNPASPEFVGSGLGADQIFADENFFSRQGDTRGIIISEVTQTTDRYEAFNRTFAGYGSVLFTIDILNFNLGVRAEANSQNITGAADQQSPYGSLNDTRDNFNVLPFVNINAKINSKLQVRAAYASTINRPELRELAPFSYYDFFYDRNMRGNPNIQQATIQNYDLRFEMYPRENSPELVSLAFFYKEFDNPIELINLNANDVFEFQNMASAFSAGIEFELKKNLDFISEYPLFKNTSFLLNAALIQSETKLSLPEAIAVNQNRPLQGQSPYIINAGLYYADDETGWSLNINYSTYGKRIVVSEANQDRPPIYELPRHFLDLSVSKKLANDWKVKLAATNILNAEYRLYLDGNFDEKINVSSNKNPDAVVNQNDPLFQSYREGQRVELSLSKKF